MKRISIQDLKAQLSAVVAAAQEGQTIIITRHNEPVARLSPAQPAHLRRGRHAGRKTLQPALRRGTKGRYLAALLEDRGTR